MKREGSKRKNTTPISGTGGGEGSKREGRFFELQIIGRGG
jgi:hypothetical protein